MNKNSDQSTGYFGSLVAGVIILSIFGFVSLLVFNMAGLKKPTDRIFEGDFSGKRTADRTKTLEVVTGEQKTAVNQEKLKSAIANFKASPQAATSVPVPGSAAALEAAKPKPKPPVEAKPEAPKPSKPVKTKADTPKAKPAAKPKDQPKPKAKAEKKGKAKAKGEEPKKAEPKNKNSQPEAQ